MTMMMMMMKGSPISRIWRKEGGLNPGRIRVRARDGRGRREGEVKRGESNNLLILHHLLCYFNTHPKKG